MKYVKKPIPVEAEQWMPGKVIDGVIIGEDEIVYSEGRSLYYISGLDSSRSLAKYWLSVEKVTGNVPEDKKNSGLFDPVYLQITLLSGETYYRVCYPFMPFEIKSDEAHEKADVTSDLYLDYIAMMEPFGWKSEPEISAYINTPAGRIFVKPGDWIVTDSNGIRKCIHPDKFAELYELVNE